MQTGSVSPGPGPAPSLRPGRGLLLSRRAGVVGRAGWRGEGGRGRGGTRSTTRAAATPTSASSRSRPQPRLVTAATRDTLRPGARGQRGTRARWGTRPRVGRGRQTAARRLGKARACCAGRLLARHGGPESAGLAPHGNSKSTDWHCLDRDVARHAAVARTARDGAAGRAAFLYDAQDPAGLAGAACRVSRPGHGAAGPDSGGYPSRSPVVRVGYLYPSPSSLSESVTRYPSRSGEAGGASGPSAGAGHVKRARARCLEGTRAAARAGSSPSRAAPAAAPHGT